MLVYIVLYFILFLSASKSFKYDYQYRCMIFFCILFWLLSWIRWETGTDWGSYCSYFENNNSYSDFMDATRTTMEDGYRLLNFLVKSISDSYTVLLFICSTFIFVIKAKFYKKFSPLPLVSLLACLALSRGDIFYVRQTISIHICMLGVMAVLKERKILFFALIIIASTIHSSSLLFSLIYPIYKFDKLELKSLNVLTITLSLICFILGAILMYAILTYLPPIISYKITKYIDEGDNMATGQSLATLLINGIINRGFFFCLFSYAAKQFYQDRTFRFFYKMYCCLMILFFMTVSINVTLTRLVSYFDVSQYILLAYFFKSRYCAKKELWLLLIGFYLFVRFYTGTLNGFYKNEFIPFRTIFGL